MIITYSRQSLNQVVIQDCIARGQLPALGMNLVDNINLFGVEFFHGLDMGIKFFVSTYYFWLKSCIHL